MCVCGGGGLPRPDSGKVIDFNRTLITWRGRSWCCDGVWRREAVRAVCLSSSRGHLVEGELEEIRGQRRAVEHLPRLFTRSEGRPLVDMCG